MQAETAAAKVAGGRRQLAEQSKLADESLDDARGDRKAEEETHLDRDERAGRPGEGLHAKSKANFRGNYHTRRQFDHGEGSGQGLVLQQVCQCPILCFI